MEKHQYKDTFQPYLTSLIFTFLMVHLLKIFSILIILLVKISIQVHVIKVVENKYNFLRFVHNTINHSN